MNKNTGFITMVTENGKEIECPILFRFYSKEFDHNYVVFKNPNDESASALIYNAAEDGTINLVKIEVEEEWDVVSDAFDQFLNDMEEGCNGNCQGCSGNCDEEECECGE